MCMHNYIDTLLQVTNKFLAYAYTASTLCLNYFFFFFFFFLIFNKKNKILLFFFVFLFLK